MAMVVQHNLTAMNANRQLESQQELRQNLQRNYLLVTESTVQVMMLLV